MKDKEDILFSQWKEKRPKLVPDGIVNEGKYVSCSKKVLYILKEVNGGKKNNSDWDLRNFLKSGGREQTWNNIAIWHYGIQNSNQNFSWKELSQKMSDKSFRKSQLAEIAAINLKKEPGSYAANTKNIWDYTGKDRELLREQVTIYNPDIFICCGTGEIVKRHQIIEDFKSWQLSAYGIRYHITKKNAVIIDYCHPAARINDNYLFFPLIETIKEIGKQHLTF